MLRFGGGRGGRGATAHEEGAVITVADATQDPWEILRRELDRARRYGRPLILIQIAPHAEAAAAPPDDPHSRRRGRFRRPGKDGDGVAYLRTHLRTGDEVWRVHERIFVMLPEADYDCAAGLVERLRTRAPHLFGATDLRLAAFPEDGLTAGALLASLTRSSAAIRRSGPGDGRPTGPREITTPHVTDEAWLRRPSRSWGAQQ
jgi:hypothetical protein